MKESEKDIYNKNLEKYSMIVKQKFSDIKDILECIKVFEYFEDYEKCADLLEILYNKKDINKKVSDWKKI